ncbi:zonular occludens toxin domain-containing protein [Acinetobacter towneri]|uniref:zonular occludens toxin domain-containing protein n=1 Tax=Acinetobacter towneri TaxID=202956 RepID=UPI002936B753|nr:zonular occludens toxin domain-containing protein [Acinetobacter towneri]MDV2485038.1 zonular occludens toxin domain-containing protein [Acinetobacter towneri]
MAIYLIVGQPRHGKSQFAVKTAYDYHLKNLEIQKRIDSGKFDPEKDIVREIYSDIEGHSQKCDFIHPAPADWRDVPDNSIIFMDEIHKRPEYTDLDGKMSQNPMIVDLTTHGHHNKDIILMTQDPQRLNKGIRALIEKMYLVKRPVQKPNFATIYEFERWLRDPWQAAASTRSVNYQDSYKFFYKKKWQDMYTSASAHTSINFKIQSKFIYAIIAIVVLMTLSYLLFTKSGGDKLARNAISGISGEKAEQVSTDQKNTVSDNQSLKNLDVECRKGVNVEKPECVQWFNNLSKSNSSIQSNDRMQAVSYNPNKPFDDEIQNNLTYEVTAKPVFSGCMKKDGRYIAYTQQGTILKDVSQADCQRVVEHGDRPFDYFRQQPNQVQNNAQLSNQANNTPTGEYSVLEAAKMEQAKIDGLI